jgi:SAM-dependent methyltransferase
MTRAAALAAVEAAVRPLMLPFRLGRPPSMMDRLSVLEPKTDELNHAAERYFASYLDPHHLLNKPFSEPESVARYLIGAGVLIDSLRIEPGDTILELGAGSCWFSHLLNRHGCRTIAVDVSPTALALGRMLFERDPNTDWTLEPLFLPYDGHRLPVSDASVNRVVLYDAYHHLPNPRELTREMRRVLGPEGIVGMAEPGRGHARSASSVAETATGVLENELSLEDVAELALACGFQAVRVVIEPSRPIMEIDAGKLRSFMGGHGFARYWRDLCAELDGHHYILLFAGDPAPTTRRPKRLKAVFGLLGDRDEIHVRSDETVHIAFDVTNAGDTRWLSANERPGWTRLGAHLHRADLARTPVDFDWFRESLPRDISPGERLVFGVTLPPLRASGSYIVTFDLVIEGVAWFAQRGSVPLEIRVEGS